MRIKYRARKVYNAEVLLDTLRARPDVAGTVRSIKFGTPYFYREETENHAAIIWLCRNLVALDLCGWNGFARAPLVEAVRSAHTLKSICINHLGISDADSEGDAFCSGLELLRMMRVWPGIEEVVIHVSALSAEFYNDSTEVPESDSNRESDDEPGSTHAEWKEERRVLAEGRQFDQTTDWSNATPCLRYMQFNRVSDSLDNTFLGRLATMAPNLQCFHADIASRAFDGLRLCLHAWRHSLRTLHILYYYDRSIMHHGPPGTDCWRKQKFAFLGYPTD
ncbi:hypothetical protein FISHEDRAFT_68756 [Fistulina hepatica ATCC 64428]|uniref:F-box domain-containing protein n=1 Tax=Fistulina hepatica ATCC 64428 TaxID=1128425 RepID=A0A0D7ANU8_9AGAR|nr:hypothetical protein FISHEDRAFT_68756 [Fistulina hepatica ATCC 64428]